jgi:hypothetical protein
MTPRFVILSEAKNLSSIDVQAKNQGGILRCAQNDSVLSFFWCLFRLWV